MKATLALNGLNIVRGKKLRSLYDFASVVLITHLTLVEPRHYKKIYVDHLLQENLFKRKKPSQQTAL